MVNIINFSGGKDSTAMLLMMLEKGMQVDRIIFIDTTKEFSGIYSNIDLVREMVLPLKIEVIPVAFDYFFSDVSKKSSSAEWTHGYGWPDWRHRWCTGLKKQAATKIANMYSRETCKQYIGLGFDEMKRKSKLCSSNAVYPLIDWKITGKKALEYCNSLGLDWGGLYDRFHRSSCWCCPFKSIGDYRTLFLDYPDYWAQLELMDKKSFRSFHTHRTVAELRARFESETMKLL